HAKKSARVPVPVFKINTDKGDKCVEPVDVMRRDHMKFILHQRDETVHEGVRTTKHGLKNCVDCHADAKTGSVLGKDGFCESCHAYAAVKLDCFECHSALREAATVTPSSASTVRALNDKQQKVSESATVNEASFTDGGSAKREAVPTGTNAGAVFPPKGRKP
ncbi:MAG: hypothetical protein AAB312_01345, partial [Pseudomonadota bacterium]